MRDIVYLGPVPADEDCEQVGTDEFDPARAREEVNRYLNGLKRMFPPPEGGRLGIKTQTHSFGVEREVVAEFDDDFPDSVDWAFNVEANAPTTWRELEQGS